MANVKQLEPEQILRAIEGEEDIITPALEQAQKEVLQKRCPECGEQASIRVDPFVPFLPNSVVPNFVPYCISCEEYI